MKTLEVHIDEHFEEFVQKMIETGEYVDASDVVSEALTLGGRQVKRCPINTHSEGVFGDCAYRYWNIRCRNVCRR